MKVQVLVRLKEGVLDVQGKAVEHGLAGLGYEDITSVRIGRLVEFDVQSDTFELAKDRATKVCEQLLANTIIENYEIREPS
ncbi:MAG: phosphoribosylformylglycinamidine synthase subunit PurS [Bdellovibrionales bacterium]|nr:phosphoribosylformylglycinamidine synthase subunit PurS [Bdellovibrionales bacterium]